jgi:hypothetical protein
VSRLDALIDHLRGSPGDEYLFFIASSMATDAGFLRSPSYERLSKSNPTYAELAPVQGEIDMPVLTPIEDPCAACAGHGRTPPTWLLCGACDGLGRQWKPNAPMYGCVITLEKAKLGDVVTLGTGERGRVVSHSKYGRKITKIRVFDPFTDEEPTQSTSYPSVTGVASIVPQYHADAGHAGRATDALDPLRR